MDHVFLDANVLFSAAYRADSGLLRLWKLSGTELIASDYAIQEARLNLSEREQHARLDRLVQHVRIASILAPLPESVKLVEKDRPILQAAIAAHATHVLTGDKRDFGALFGKRIGGVLILLPADYFALRKHH